MNRKKTAKPKGTHLYDASDVHLGDHLRSQQEGHDKVDGEGHIDELRVHVEGLWRIHAHGDQTERTRLDFIRQKRQMCRIVTK